jgi:hypothetical protein
LEGILSSEILIGVIEEGFTSSGFIEEEILLGELKEETLVGSIEGFIIRSISLSNIDGGAP